MKTLWAATTVSSLGSWLLVVAVPAQVFVLTGSPFLAGLGLAVEALPALVIGPWAGVVADRHDHRRILIGSDLCAAAGVALLFLCTRRSLVTVVYLGLLLENVAVAFHRPAARAVIPALVGTGGRLATVNSLTAVSGAVLRLAGPPLGTVLLAYGGLPLVVGVDVASYLTSALLLLRLRTPTLPDGAGPPESAGRPPGPPDSAGQPPGPTDGAARTARSAGSLAEGLRMLVATPLLRSMLVASWLFWTANAALTALLVPFLVRRLHGSPHDLGYLIGALGAGYVVGSLISRPVLTRAAARTTLVGCYSAVGLCFLALFHAPSLGWALIFVGVAGIPGALAATMTQHKLLAVERFPKSLSPRARARLRRNGLAPNPVVGRLNAVFLAGDAAAAVIGALAGPLVASGIGLGGALDAFSGLVLVAAVAAGRRGPRARPR